MASSAPLVVIVGPTASGKTALAIEIAKQHNGEIICADSRTVYAGLDTGTAKPTVAEQAMVKHHGIDLVTPDASFTAADFQQYANKKIEEISTRSRLPIMVGGTGLWIDSVLFNYQFGGPADRALRQELAILTTEELRNRCMNDNIELPQNTKNRRHLTRAIEQNGINNNRDKLPREHTVVIGIDADRTTLEGRIRARAEQLFAHGAVIEASQLAAKYGWDCEAMTGNIYRVARRLLNQEITENEAFEQFIRSDLQLAKRQRTWFRRNQFIHWSQDPTELKDYVEHFLASEKSTV